MCSQAWYAFTKACTLWHQLGWRPRLGEGAEEAQRQDAQLQSEARRPKRLGPGADVRGASEMSVRPAAQGGAAAGLPCGARPRREGLPQQPEQLTFCVANVLHAFRSPSCRGVYLLHCATVHCSAPFDPDTVCTSVRVLASVE